MAGSIRDLKTKKKKKNVLASTEAAATVQLTAKTSRSPPIMTSEEVMSECRKQSSSQGRISRVLPCNLLSRSSCTSLHFSAVKGCQSAKKCSRSPASVVDKGCNTDELVIIRSTSSIGLPPIMEDSSLKSKPALAEASDDTNTSVDSSDQGLSPLRTETQRYYCDHDASSPVIPSIPPPEQSRAAVPESQSCSTEAASSSNESCSIERNRIAASNLVEFYLSGGGKNTLRRPLCLDFTGWKAWCKLHLS
ncbi:hypothetical protein BDL97_13G042500 [Sphagnum fallax]|nr:hypothetical protein BDL97_13G042500 [Sphagnum fallax]